MKFLSSSSVLALVAGFTLVAGAVPASAQDAFQSLRSSQRSSRQQSGQEQQQQQQQDQQQQQRQQGQRQISGLNRAESNAVMPVYEAVQAQNWEAARAGLPAAEQGARSAQGRYVIGQLKLQIARGTNDNALMAQAVNEMIESGAAPADQLEVLRRVQREISLNQAARSDPAAAEAQLTQLLADEPNNPERMIQLAEVKERLDKHAEAVDLYRRAIAASETDGGKADQNLYRRALAIAYRGQLGPQSIELGRDLVAAYPNAQNWRDALLIYRQFSDLDGAMALDLFRLQRAAHALSGEADYVGFAQQLLRNGLPGEAKAVLDEGLAGGTIQAGSANVAPVLAQANGQVEGDRAGLAGQRAQAMAGNARQARATGDAYYGYGQYAEAAALYRAALEKGGDEADLVNLRLGAALAGAGQSAQAEAALRAVNGPRATLAAYWLLLLAQPPQG